MKNLILALALVGTTYTGTINLTTTPLNKTNTYENTVYNNNELTLAEEKATINFSEQLQTNLTLKQRAVITTYRDIGRDDYSIVYNLFIAIDTTLIREDYNPTNYTLVLNPPLQNDIINQEMTVYKYTALTTEQNNFLNGKNYNSYNDLVQLETNLRQNQTQETTDTNLNNYISLELSNEKYLRIAITTDYDAQAVSTTNGTELLNNMYTLEREQIQITYDYTINESNYEVIDLGGLMFEILGMPFAWLSIAFNFTLFPNTPYAINISTLLLGLLVALIALIIFRIVMKGS